MSSSSSNNTNNSMRFAKECDSKRIESVQVYQAKLAAGVTKGGRTIRLYNVIFLLLYIYQLGWVVSTIGEPYRQFLEKADREGFQVMEGSTRLRAELEHSVQDLNDPNRRTKKIGWTDWMDMDIEELAAEKKRDRERNVLDSLPKNMRVPHRHAASFWPTLVTGILATLHALVLLLQHWSVGFNVWINYQEINADVAAELPEHIMELDLVQEEEQAARRKAAMAAGTTSAGGGGGSSSASKDGNNVNLRVPDRAIAENNIPSHLPTHARIVPTKGRHILLPLAYYPTLGMTFEYHRRRYVYDAEHAVWSKIRCRTDLPLQFLSTQWQGFGSRHRVIAGQIRYGANMFNVKSPSFGELYKKQILNPFSVFQIFCVLLWAIDDYVIYSCFSLFMVLMFEGTVVFQRLKSLQALRGMGNPSRHVYVYREAVWTQVDTSELLPGDLMSLTRVAPHLAKQKDGDDNKKKKKPPASLKVEDDGGDIVPADLLLLRGSTVVNEASLTGESVPQMKERLNTEFAEGELLNMKTTHKMNVAYAGTKMLQCKGVTEADVNDNDDDDNDGGDKKDGKNEGSSGAVPPPPDHGCLCFVLRTGFASAQGKLVRMIEGSQEKVKGHERETGLLLLLLCFFAVISSSYVLYHGSQDESRSKYELLLHCILIVTSVIRPELPMQMALAVNNSLMTLMKMHIFCTEPYKVPAAGKLDVCLFDKTGTLTTDELVAVGICEPKTPLLHTTKSDQEDENFLTPMNKIANEAAFVLAGCHSLVVIDEETQGDPLEKSALKSMRWHISSSTGHAEPAPATEKKPAGKTIRLSSIGQHETDQVQILTRHHFSSKLQRMSCVVQSKGRRHFSVAKGSPEAIGRLLADNKPPDYDAKAEYLSKQGYRVISLALKPLSSDAEIKAAQDSRASCEADLHFAGFIAFTCMVRKDTAHVLRRLKEGGMGITMVTGDALLTAIHVAKEVDICEELNSSSSSGDGSSDGIAAEENEEIKALLESKQQQGSQNGRGPGASKKKKNSSNKKSHKTYRPIAYLDTTPKKDLYWRSYQDGNKVEDYVAADIPRLAADYDLATTGACLNLAFEQDEDTGKFLGHIKVFARMTPDAKETVIECLHSVGNLCLMCGDGANDVGALKQADVGVALLSGFGNLNVQKADDEGTKKKKDDDGNDDGVRAIMSKEHLDQVRALPIRLLKMKLKSMGVDPAKYPQLVEKEDLVQLYQIKARELAVKRHDKQNELAKKKMTKAELQAEQKRAMQEKQQRMMQRAAELEAQGESFATFKAMKEFWAAEMEETKKKKGELARARGVEGSAATLAAQLDELDTGDMPVVKLGDASIAAPFTSKMPSIKSCVDIVRQGRCTLVSSIQMYQIMALQCLISSYSLSVLYLDGVKYADTQLTAMGLLGSVSFMSVSRSRPLDKLSRVRPLNSIFHPALFFSLLGQFAIHLGTMVFAVHSAKKHLPPDYSADLDGQFKPGILNTVVFLVSSVQQVTVFFVNLQGRPFMTGVTENRPLLWSLVATFILTFMFASETVPGLNRYFQLVPFPDETFRNFILTILAMDLIATFCLDRLMKFFFCRNILKAGFEETSMKDVVSLAKTFAVVGFLMYSFMGSSEQWDLLLEMEMNATMNATDGVEVDASSTLGDVVQECVGAACETIQASAEAIRDEF